MFSPLFEKVELFQGALRFSPFWMTVDLLIIAHFFTAWYFSWKKSGWKLDFWWLSLFLQFFIYIFLMYPFNASLFNFPWVKGNLVRIEPFVDRAFAIGTLGYIFMWVGRYLHDLSANKILFLPFRKVLNGIERIIVQNISSRLSRNVLVVLTLGLTLFIFPHFLSAGRNFSARDFFLQNDLLRPFFNLTLCCYTITIWYLGVSYQQWRKKQELMLLITFFLLSAFLGSRALLISSIIFVLTYRVFFNRGRVSFWKTGAVCMLLLFIALLLGSLRENAGVPKQVLMNFGKEAIYGNHFSDTRDFAWMLSCWDGELLYGKTYLAGLLSFLPRIASDFRANWSYGVYSANLAELELHAGLRSGPFGEMYFNFGLVGVILIGLLAGYVLRMADVRLKLAITNENSLVKGFASTFLYFLVCNFFNTSGFWLFYFFIFINLLLYLLQRSKTNEWQEGRVD